MGCFDGADVTGASVGLFEGGSLGKFDGLKVSGLLLGDMVGSDVVGFEVTGLRLGDLVGLKVVGFEEGNS